MQFETLVDNTDFNTMLQELATIETWIPKTTEIQSNNQRPTDSCFGGKCSIHPEEQIDPNGYKFSFQFKSPNEHTFYRVFLATNENNTPEAAKIFPIEAHKMNSMELFSMKTHMDKIYKIDQWVSKLELPNFEEICNKIGIKWINPGLVVESPCFNLQLKWHKLIKQANYAYDSFRENYYNSIYAPMGGLKFLGTSVTTQATQLESNWWQISESPEFSGFSFGDAGIAHIYDDGYVHFDCC